MYRLIEILARVVLAGGGLVYLLCGVVALHPSVGEGLGLLAHGLVFLCLGVLWLYVAIEWTGWSR